MNSLLGWNSTDEGLTIACSDLEGSLRLPDELQSNFIGKNSYYFTETATGNTNNVSTSLKINPMSLSLDTEMEGTGLKKTTKLIIHPKGLTFIKSDTNTNNGTTETAVSHLTFWNGEIYINNKRIS
jgi:hypothetical protein